MPEIKTGIGEDSHRFVENKKLVLGGFEINCDFGFLGNSDGDIIIHSLCNAFDVVSGFGSLSNYSDKMSREGKNESRLYLEHNLDWINDNNWRIMSISISLEGSKPKLEKYLPKIKDSLAKMMKIESGRIGLTVTSGEDLSDFGRGDGMKAVSVVTFGTTG